MIGLQHLDIAQCPGVVDSTLGSILRGPKLGTEYAEKWQEYNNWILDGKWTSFVLSDKDRKEIDEARTAQEDWRTKIAGYTERLDVLSKEIGGVEKSLADRPESRRFQKELEKAKKRYSIMQTRVAQAKQKIIELENDIANKGSIGHDQRRPVPGPRMALQTLNISGSNLSDRGFARIASRCPDVRRVKLSYCDSDHFTDGFAAILQRAWPKVEEIDMAGCSQIGDEGIIKMTKGCENLTRLIVGGCSLTISGAQAIGANCEHLRELDLTGCTGLTDIALDDIVKCNVDLCDIRVDFCELLSDEFIQVLRQRERRKEGGGTRRMNVIMTRRHHYERPAPRHFVFDPSAAGKGGKKGKKKNKKKKKKR
eukprot:g3333.t1